MHLRPLALIRALLVVPLALLTACSFSFSVGGFDYSALEDAIEAELLTSYEAIDVTLGEVQCPHQDEDPEEGDVFICTAAVDEGTVRVEARVGEDDNVSFLTLDRIYVAEATAATLTDEVAAQVGFDVSVDCGQGIRIVATGSTFECTVTDPNGVAAAVQVTSTDSGISWEILQ